MVVLELERPTFPSVHSLVTSERTSASHAEAEKLIRIVQVEHRVAYPLDLSKDF